MSDILEQIVRAKQREIAEKKQIVPLEQLKEQIASLPRPRNFFQAVTGEMQAKDAAASGRPAKLIHLIAEVKKASPSAGIIRADFDPVEIARVYARAGADALSVLTDEPYFQGKLEYIAAIRQQVAIPVLRKDFIIDPWQVYESRLAGADAILLIAECLETAELIDLQILATELNLTCLVEVHTLENFMRVRDHVIGLPHRSYSLLGINNRDLRTFKTDLGTTLRLAELVEDRRVLVSESGVHTRQDVEKLAAAGVGTALVGESLMRSGDVETRIRGMFHRHADNS